MKQQAKQSEIINAAHKLFTTFGFEKTTMTDIARQMGISKASVYYYFTDKESIIKALAIRDQENFVREIEDITADIGNTRDKLIAYAIKRNELLQGFLTLSSMNLGTYNSIRSLFRTILIEFRKRESNLVTEILRLGIEKQEISKIDALEYAELFLDVLKGLRIKAFYNIEDNETRNLQLDNIMQVQKQAQMFTETFINGITK